jgi:alpha-acetolactate decarboxylase
VTLRSDLAGPGLDSWIVEQAKAAGLDVTKPFPVRLKGTLAGVKMHVIRAFNPNFKGHGSGHAMADQEDITAAKIEGEVVGFYSPPDAQGVITHPGESFHYHWVNVGRTRTAHLDAFGMTKGAQLLLPRH